MNVSKLFIAVATLAIAGSASAGRAPAENAVVSAMLAAHISITAESLNIPVVLVNKSSGRTRAEVRAEAVDAVKNQRATEASQFEWIAKSHPLFLHCTGVSRHLSGETP